MGWRSWAAGLGQAARRAPELRARAVLLEGAERSSGEPLASICVVAIEAKAYFSELVFRGRPTATELPPTWIWNLDRLALADGAAASLMVVDLHRSQLRWLRPEPDFFVPAWLSTVAPVPDDPHEAPSTSLAQDLHRVRRLGLRFELRRDVESFERYHERLYLPHLRRSQGASAVPLSRTKHRAAFDRGELLLVFAAEPEAIAGAVLTEGEALPRIRSLGIADEVPFALQRGAGPAVYVFAMQRFRERGFSTVSLGRSRAFLDDGVLTFKNKWSHRIESGSGRGFAMKLLRPSRGLASFLAANPFVFERRGMHAALFSAEGDSVEAREALLDRRHIRGLASVQLFSTDGRPIETDVPRRDRVSPPDALTHAVDVLLGQLLRLRARERLLVYSERPADDPLLRALILNAEEIGARPEVLQLSPSGGRGEHGATVARALRNRGYDAAIELSADSLYLTAAWSVARAIGCRIYSIAGLDAESVVRCVGEVDHVRTWAFGAALRDRIVRSKEIRVRCARGTDLRMGLRSRLPRERRGFFGRPCGRLKHERDATFLSGQIAFRGVRSTFEGVAMVDGCLAPPDDIGRLRSPLELRFARGRLTDMNGSAREIDALRAWVGTDAARLEHLCLGFNSGARISDSALESERVFGALTVGFGEGPRHTDAVITRPTIELDREPLEVDGRFVLAALRSEQRRLLGERDGDP